MTTEQLQEARKLEVQIEELTEFLNELCLSTEKTGGKKESYVVKLEIETRIWTGKEHRWGEKSLTRDKELMADLLNNMEPFLKKHLELLKEKLAKL